MHAPCDDHLSYVDNGMSAHLSPKKSSGATSERRPMPSTAFFTRTFKSALASVVLLQRICLHLSPGLKECRTVGRDPARGLAPVIRETPLLMVCATCQTLKVLRCFSCENQAANLSRHLSDIHMKLAQARCRGHLR